MSRWGFVPVLPGDTGGGGAGWSGGRAFDFGDRWRQGGLGRCGLRRWRIAMGWRRWRRTGLFVVTAVLAAGEKATVVGGG